MDVGIILVCRLWNTYHLQSAAVIDFLYLHKTCLGMAFMDVLGWNRQNSLMKLLMSQSNLRKYRERNSTCHKIEYIYLLHS